jgi:hypothetical protein
LTDVPREKTRNPRGGLKALTARDVRKR